MTAYNKSNKLHNLLFIFIILLFCFLFISCSSNNVNNPINPVNIWLHSIVEIQVRDEDNAVVGNATGTVISKDGYILTNKHVVRSYDYQSNEYIIYDNIYIRWYNSNDFVIVSLIAISQDDDLAILKINDEINYSFDLKPNLNIAYGDRVHTIGNSNGYGLSYANGYVAAPRRKVKYDGMIIEAIQVDMNIYEGNSGGPLINDDGDLIGITTFRLRDKQNEVIYGTCFAIPIDTVRDFVYNYFAD